MGKPGYDRIDNSTLKMKKLKDIIKVNKYNSYDDIMNFEGVLEPIGNAHYFFIKFFKSSDNIRINKNPYNIKYDRMKNEFGEPNFKDSYKGAYWWILKFQEKLFAVYTHKIEGSEIYQFLHENKDYCYNKQFSVDVENFYNELL